MVRRTGGNSTLQLLSALEVLHAKDGDLSDGGGLLLRVRGESASWVLRYTAATGRRREMGLGIADRGSQKRAGAEGGATFANSVMMGGRQVANAGATLLRSQAKVRDLKSRQAGDVPQPGDSLYSKYGRGGPKLTSPASSWTLDLEWSSTATLLPGER